MLVFLLHVFLLPHFDLDEFIFSKAWKKNNNTERSRKGIKKKMKKAEENVKERLSYSFTCLSENGKKREE